MKEARTPCLSTSDLPGPTARTLKHPLSLQGWFNLLNLPGLLSSCFPEPLSCLQPPLPLLPFVSSSLYWCQVVLHITVLPAQCYCPLEPRLLTACCWDSSEHLCSRHWPLPRASGLFFIPETRPPPQAFLTFIVLAPSHLPLHIPVSPPRPLKAPVRGLS